MSVAYQTAQKEKFRITLEISAFPDFNPHQIDWKKLFNLEPAEKVTAYIEDLSRMDRWWHFHNWHKPLLRIPPVQVILLSWGNRLTHVTSLIEFIMTTATAFTSTSIMSISDVNDDSQVEIVYHSNPDKVYTYHVNDIEGWETELQDTIDEQESVGAFVNRARKSQMIVEVWFSTKLNFLRAPKGPFFVFMGFYGNNVKPHQPTQNRL